MGRFAPDVLRRNHQAGRTVGAMPEDFSSHPHDRLFKSSLGEPATAASFLRVWLPESLSRVADWSRMRREEGSFVGPDLRASESDLLFSLPLGERPAFVYLLLEHLRKRDPRIPLRLLRYMLLVWESFWASNPGVARLPPIVPIIIAHNAEPWNLPEDFRSLVELPEEIAGDLAPFLPDFRFRLIELARTPFEDLQGTPGAVLVLRAMKAETLGRLFGDEVWDEALILQDLSAFERVVLYILSVSRHDIDTTTFERKLSTLRSAQVRQTAMTLAQQLQQEGRQEGRQEGLIASKQDDIIQALEVRFGAVPETISSRVAALTDLEVLGSLLRHAITSVSLEEFGERLLAQ